MWAVCPLGSREQSTVSPPLTTDKTSFTNSPMNSFRDIITVWPTRREMALELGAGTTVDRVQIGRASCRERVEGSALAVASRTKQKLPEELRRRAQQQLR